MCNRNTELNLEYLFIVSEDQGIDSSHGIDATNSVLTDDIFGVENVPNSNKFYHNNGKDGNVNDIDKAEIPEKCDLSFKLAHLNVSGK